MTPTQLELHRTIYRALKGALEAYHKLIVEWEKKFN